MSDLDLDALRAEIAERCASLETTQRVLKKRSTISFAERQSLSNRAARAAAELREHAAALETLSEGAEGLEAAVANAREALDRSVQVLGQVDAAAPVGPQHGGAGPGRGLPGQQRRGVSGLSQQRAPNRSGSE